MSVYQRGRVYYFDFQLDGVRHVKRVGPSKQAAKDAEQVARARALEGRYQREWGLRRGAAPTVRAFLDGEYRQEVESTMAPTTARKRLLGLGRFAARHGPLRLDHVRGPTLEAYRAERAPALRPVTLRNEFAWLRRFFESARRRGYLPVNPAHAIQLPRAADAETRTLEGDEDLRLLKAVLHPVARAAILLALLTGLRRGEVVRLERRHVDLDGRRLVLVQPKTGRVKRVPLVPEALAALRTARPDYESLPPDAALFLNREGRPFTAFGLWYHFQAARRRAGLSGIRLHDLRHTVATRLLRTGADLATVGEILGHGPPYLQTRRYSAHVSEDRMREALERMVSQYPQLSEGEAPR